MTDRPAKPADDRAARLAQALRSNLRRRKAQARATVQPEPGEEKPGPPPSDQ